ncbi:MAG TPA: hypothetical protein VIB38_15615 [Aestuariivirgaceae bacterium]
MTDAKQIADDWARGDIYDLITSTLKKCGGLQVAIEKAESGTPPLGIHLLLGETAPQSHNAARNIEEGRTHPIQLICRKPV